MKEWLAHARARMKEIEDAVAQGYEQGRDSEQYPRHGEIWSPQKAGGCSCVVYCQKVGAWVRAMGCAAEHVPKR